MIEDAPLGLFRPRNIMLHSIKQQIASLDADQQIPGDVRDLEGWIQRDPGGSALSTRVYSTVSFTQTCLPYPKMVSFGLREWWDHPADITAFPNIKDVRRRRTDEA